MDSLALLNEYTDRFGMTLTPAAAERLQEARLAALSQTGRAELGGGVLPELCRAFADSPYIQSRDWEQTLAELQEIFYEAKSDCEDRIADASLIRWMVKVYNGKAGGSLEYLSGTALPALCRYARDKGLPPEVDAFWEGGSVREETARELLEGAAFTLGLSGESAALAPLSPDFRLRLGEGVKRLEAEVRRGRALYSRACLTAPAAENWSYTDTLKSIGGFFERYDPRRFPLRIPCDIDYQLCRPMSEELRGVFYVNEYLRRVIIENALLGRFAPARVEALLTLYRRDYRELLINLCEPVMTNALGLALVGGEPGALILTAAERVRAEELLRGLSDTPGRAALTGAAAGLARSLDLSPAETDYLRESAAELWPRIRTVLGAGGLEGVFLSDGQ